MGKIVRIILLVCSILSVVRASVFVSQEIHTGNEEPSCAIVEYLEESAGFPVAFSE